MEFQQYQHQQQNHQTNSQLSDVTLALKDLNRSLPQDRQIKLIILLYSKFSQKSDILIKSIPTECRPFFYYICIDNKTIRKKIKESTTMKITEVPCIIVIDINDTISIYEGDKSVEIIKTIYNINKQHQLSKHGPNCQCPLHKASNISDTVTPISQLDMKSSNDYPSERKQPPIRSPIPDKLPVPPQDDDLASAIDDSATRIGGVRSKVRHANRPIESTRIREQDPPEVGISSIRNAPIRGLGHENMAHTSLKDVTGSKPKPKNTPISISGGEMLDDELDDMLDEDPTLDVEIRSTKKAQYMDKKEAMDSVKKAAMEMQKMRSLEEEEENNNR